MGSIFGFTGVKGDLLSMQNKLRHWNPDRENVYQDENISLGALELFNVPESPLTAQPFHYKNWIITADCRIDNRDELAKEFSIANLSDHADIEYIAFAFEKWGQECVRHLIGDFAFVVWDKDNKELFAATDHFGIKTLYYTLVNNELVFASEIKAILIHPDFVREINESSVVAEFSDFQIPYKNTLYTDLFLLKPGHSLSFKKNELKDIKYWTFGEKIIDIPSTVDEQESEFNRLCYKSVENRLRTYGKIGPEASGGLDSSGIECMAMEILGEGSEFYSFTYGKPEQSAGEHDKKDDVSIVREICAKYRIDKYLTVLNEKDLNLEEILNLLDNVLDEIESNNVPLFTASFLKYAKAKKCGVILSGWGGDQSVTNTYGGFDNILSSKKQYRKLWKQISLKEKFPKSILRFLYFLLKELDSNHFYKMNVKLHQINLNKGHLKSRIIDKYQLRSIPNEKFIFKNCSDSKSYQKLNLTKKSFLKRAYQHEQIGKHFNIEYRFPMLDLRLLEYIFCLPESTVLPQRKIRYLYTKCVNDIVPKEVVDTKKSKVPTTPFARAFINVNSTFLLNNLMETLSNSSFNSYFDIDKMKSSDDQKLNKFSYYLKYHFLKDKL